MEMVSMKRPKKTKAQMEAENKASIGMYEEADKYPYGLKINLNKDEIEKLGIDVGKLRAEQTGMLHAKIAVTDIRSHETTRPDNDSVRVELQITDMSIELGEMKKKKKTYTEYQRSTSAIGGLVG